jgi:rod shape-determining protein MreC
VPVSVAGVGRVVSVDPIGFPTWLTVEAGGISAAGNEPAVIAPNGGLVGRVVETMGRHHRVMTIFNPLSSVSVSLQESRNLGVLKNDGLPPALNVQYVGNDSPVVTGEEIVTSALGHTIPAGIPVGTVRRAAAGPGFFQEIGVQPKVNFSRLEEVVFVY